MRVLHRSKRVECIQQLSSWPPRQLTLNERAMPVLALLSVFIGAGFGACLRWWLGLSLNPVFPVIPLGTLAANLIGGYVIGLAVAFFALETELPPEVRLFVITGFLGGLNLFLGSCQSVGRSAIWLGVGGDRTHMLGSFGATAVGIFTMRAVLRATG
jgi:CrcB protein